MLTINYKGKTYTTKPHTQWEWIVEWNIATFRNKWFLEEVEEKIEVSSAKKFKCISMDESRKSPSILEKLPEFDYLKITEWENYKFATLAKQVECITRLLNKKPWNL